MKTMTAILLEPGVKNGLKKHLKIEETLKWLVTNGDHLKGVIIQY